MADMSDDEVAGEAGDTVGSFYGPTSWEDVDTNELVRVALHISQNVVPSTEQNSDVAARLAMQAAALTSETMDPLGLGRIDTRSLTLAQAQRDRPANRSRNARKSISIEAGHLGMASIRRVKEGRSSSGALDGGSEGSGLTPLQQQVGNGASLSHLRKMVLPSSESFKPDVYLGLVHADTALEELKEGRISLKAELSERTGQMKALVKDNFERFISCKNTIDDIHTRLLKAEKARSGDNQGVSSSDMLVALAEIQEEGRRAFAAMLERATMSERIRSVISLLKRYESLFRLPTRIRQASQDGQYEQVISEHRKAKALVQSIIQPRAESTVWHNLFVEVEKGVESMVAALAALLQDARTPAGEAADAVKHVLQLAVDGAPSAAALNPVALWVEAQDAAVNRQLEAVAEEQRQWLAAEQERAEDQEASDARWAQLQTDDQGGSSSGQATPSSVGRASHAPCPESPHGGGHRGGALRAALHQPEHAETDQLWEKFVTNMTNAVTRHLPVLWAVPQERLKPLASISPRAKQLIDAGTADALRRAGLALQVYGEHIRASFRALSASGEGCSQDTFLCVLRTASGGLRALREAGGPEKPLQEVLQMTLEAATEAALTEMATERALLVANIAVLADWEAVPGSHKTGTPVSKLPGLLNEVVVKGMERVQAVISQAAAADGPSHVFQPLGSLAGKVRAAFFDCFAAYALATDKLAASTTTGAAPDDSPDQVPPDRKLLVLVSDCSHVRSHIMPLLSLRHSSALAVNGGAQESRTLSHSTGQELQQVETRLVNMYLESKNAIVNDMLEEYFTGDGTPWESASLPVSLRDVALDLVNTLVEIEAEVYSGAPNMQGPLMEQLLGIMLSAAHSVIAEELTGVSVGGLLQLWVEMLYLQKVVGPQLGKAAPVCTETLTLLSKRLAEALKNADQTLLDQLERYTEGVQGDAMMQRVSRASQQVARAALSHSHLNALCFQRTAAAG